MDGEYLDIVEDMTGVVNVLKDNVLTLKSHIFDLIQVITYFVNFFKKHSPVLLFIFSLRNRRTNKKEKYYYQVFF